MKIHLCRHNTRFDDFGQWCCWLGNCQQCREYISSSYKVDIHLFWNKKCGIFSANTHLIFVAAIDPIQIQMWKSSSNNNQINYQQWKNCLKNNSRKALHWTEPKISGTQMTDVEKPSLSSLHQTQVTPQSIINHIHEIFLYCSQRDKILPL